MCVCVYGTWSQKQRSAEDAAPDGSRASRSADSSVSYLSQVQGDVHLVVLRAAGQRRALPPPLSAIDGVGDGMGAVTVALAADVAVLTLRRNKGEINNVPINRMLTLLLAR